MRRQGLITDALEGLVKTKLREHGIVVWLDSTEAYVDFVDRLVEKRDAGEFLAPVVPYRGSFLEMLLALDSYGNGLDPELLLVHLPGYNYDTVGRTPLLELYHAGYRFERALPTLVREVASGRVDPAEIDRFLADGSFTLADAESWLESHEAWRQGGFAAELESLQLSWILESVLGSGDEWSRKLRGEDREAAESRGLLLGHLRRHTGLDERFTELFLGGEPSSFDDLALVFAAWLLCVEYAHDLKRPPHSESLRPLERLSGPLRGTCLDLVKHLRDHLPEAYASYAATVEDGLADELAVIAAEDLGRIDTFEREVSRILEAAVEALGRGEWSKALDWASARTPEASFWISRDEKQRMSWKLVDGAARLGAAIEESGRPFADAESLTQATEIYASEARAVDRAHRRFEQLRLELLSIKLPVFEGLRAVADDLRRRHRRWADELTRDWSALCDRDGFLPGEGFQQRRIYERRVDPLLRENDRVVLFLVDAFRFEMATELLGELEGAGAKVRLEPCLAELPTITPVGMNALAPVTRGGRLTLAGSKGFTGFVTGEFSVVQPDDRLRAMTSRSLKGGRHEGRLLSLDDVCSWSPERLARSLRTARLIVVHSREIDEAGEINVGLATFESWLRQLRSAWHRLKNMGIEAFVFTADHGFLIQDPTTLVPKAYGTKRTPKRRYAESPHPETSAETVAVSYAALGYEGREGYLIFRRDTQLFDTGKTAATFAHGGNSPQERIIPVLTVHYHRHQRLGGRFRIEAKALEPREGLSRLRLTVAHAEDSQSVLAFVGSRFLDVTFRVPERPDIEIAMKDARGAELADQKLRLRVGEPAEVFFELRGEHDERVRLEIYHPAGEDQVTPLLYDHFFDVAGRPRRVAEPQSAGSEPGVSAGAPAGADWAEALGDPAVGRVFLHVAEHGAITESELAGMLGGARRARRFARRFDEYVDKVPFTVRTENVGGVKRYVKGR